MWNQELPIYGQIVAPAYDQPQCMRRFLMRELLPLSADARTVLSSLRRAAPSDRFHPSDVACSSRRTVSVSECDAIQAVKSIRLKMAKTGSIASTSFDTGATVALIGNAVGYVGPMIARSLFKAQC
jgi:hypothetical protein